jgi:hypothetical protein
MSTQWEQLNETVINYTSIIPVYIAFFMIITSAFNQDVKALYWLFCILIGIGIISQVFTKVVPMFSPPIEFEKFIAQPVNPSVSIFSNYPKCSISAFFISFTIVYLVFSMHHYKDYNYWVILLFIGLYLVDVLYSKYTLPIMGRFIGTFVGGVYGYICYLVAKKINAERLLYFTVDSSNRKYCSRPKKQQFKCFVYKGGQLVSST